MKNNILKLYGGMAILMLAMGNGSVLAEDGKTYPASFCTFINQNYAGPFSISAGEWINESKYATTVECPIIKDGIGKGLRNGFVRVIDNNYERNKNVECTITSRRTQIHPSQGFSTTVKTNGYSTAVQTLNFSSLGHNGKNTIYSMQCTIPGKMDKRAPSKIMGYYISENT